MLGSHRRQLERELRSAHPGHHDIGDEQLDHSRIELGGMRGSGGVRSGEDGVTVPPHHFRDHVPYRRVVLDDEDRFVPVKRHRRRESTGTRQ